MKLLGTISAIGEARNYQRKSDMSYGVVYPIEFTTGSDVIVFDIFMSKDMMDKRSIIVGAIGTVDLEFSKKTKTSQSGASFTSQNIRFKGWELANGNIHQEPVAEQPKQEGAAQPF